VVNLKTSKRTGKVVGFEFVDVDDEVVLISVAGKIIRTRVADVSVIGRATQGVRVIDLGEGDTLVAVAKVVEKD